MSANRWNNAWDENYGLGAIGDGVNVDNIRQCFDILVEREYDGVVSIECEGQGGPMIEKSLAWVRELVDDANRRIAAKQS